MGMWKESWEAEAERRTQPTETDSETLTPDETHCLFIHLSHIYSDSVCCFSESSPSGNMQQATTLYCKFAISRTVATRLDSYG